MLWPGDASPRIILAFPWVNATGGVATRGIATAHARRAGMGAGEYAATFGNLRALVHALGPLFYTRLYAYQLERKGNTGASFIAAGLVGARISYLVIKAAPGIAVCELGTVSQVNTKLRSFVVVVRNSLVQAFVVRFCWCLLWSCS